MSDQLTHKETSFPNKKFPIILLLDNIIGEANLGSMFRLADAFGVQRIIFCGSEPNLQSNRLRRTARNTYKIVDFEFRENSAEAIKALIKEGFKTLAIEITACSKPMENFSFQNNEKLVLIAGNEIHGISNEALEVCDECYHIEMFGENSSMNVAQSVGIALFEITKAFHKFDKK